MKISFYSIFCFLIGTLYRSLLLFWLMGNAISICFLYIAKSSFEKTDLLLRSTGDFFSRMKIALLSPVFIYASVTLRYYIKL